MQENTWVPDDAKLKELIVYIAYESEPDEYFGAIKLNKLLFFSDYQFYLETGRSITRQEYMALPQGPVPRKLIPLREQLIENGDIEILSRQFYNREQHRPCALRYADLSIFTAQEISLVDSVIRQHWGKSARQISHDSHLFIGWQYAREKETIPYCVTLIGNRPLTSEEVAYGLGLESLAKECLGR